MAQGRFRSDLFHRLSQFTLYVPPLRSRPADIEPLARHFLAEHFPGLEMGSSAMSALRNYSWPGNIRELRNAVIQAGVSVLVSWPDHRTGFPFAVGASFPQRCARLSG